MKKYNLTFLFIIGLMCSIGLIATDIYIPVMPQISHYFGASQHALQMTLSIYLIGLAISQLFYGPLSDRYGRKPMVLVGITIFIIATFMCMLSVSVDMFIGTRLLQAIGACSGMTIGRAIVSDSFNKKESARIFTIIYPIVGLSPAISPVIGGFISHISSWRMVFAFVILASIVLFLLTLFVLPETKSKESRTSIRPSIILEHYKGLLKHKTFWGYALVPCFAYIGYFGYLAESPFLFHHFHYSTMDISFFYISLSLSYLLGNNVAKRLITYTSLEKTILIGYGCFASGGLLFVVLSLIGTFNAVDLILPATVLTFGNGFLLPLGTAGLVGRFTKISGYASGLMGALQLGSAGLSAYLVGLLSRVNPNIFALYMLMITFLGLSLFMWLVPVNFQPKKRERNV